LNVNWNDNCFKPILAMELKTLGKTVSLSNRKKKAKRSREARASITRRWPCTKSISLTLHLMVKITVHPSISDSAILLQEHP
jgi:hypothetical protein